MERQKSLTLQAVERMTSIIVLPHPDRDRPEIANLRPDPETEAIAMRVATEYEQSQGRVVEDVSEKNLGYDLTSIDTNSGELRLIEVKGIGAEHRNRLPDAEREARGGGQTRLLLAVRRLELQERVAAA